MNLNLLLFLLFIFRNLNFESLVCHSSCYTWDNSTECTSWTQYMMLNSTSKLWQFCPDGQFYAQSINFCIDWGTSCTVYCAYRSTCFDWPSGQFYDIDLMSWVQNWNITTQISINSTQTGNKAYWRSFNYYVNPLSTEVVELGSK